MKKLLTIFMLFVVVGMITPLATAEEDRTDTNIGDDGTDDGIDDMRDEMKDRLDAARYELNNRKDELKDMRDEMKDREKEMLDRIKMARNNLKEQEKRVRERAKDVRAYYKATRDKYHEKRNEFSSGRDRLKKCEKDGSDCTEERKKHNDRSAALLLSSAESLIGQIDRLLEHLEGSDRDTTDSIAKLEEIRLDVEATIIEIEALGDDFTRDDLLVISEHIKGLWKDVKRMTNVVTKKSVNHKIGVGFRKMKNLEDRLYLARDSLVERGADAGDIEELNALLDKFSSLLDIVEQHYTAANSETGDSTASVEQLDDDVISARKAFNEAVHMLREIIHEIRDIGADLLGERREGIEHEDIGVTDDDETDDEEVDDLESEAADAIENAKEEIAKAEEDIEENLEDGREAGASVVLLEEARVALENAVHEFEEGNFEAAEEYADDAEDIAKDARMKYLGKTTDELEADRAGDDHGETGTDEQVVEAEMAEAEDRIVRAEEALAATDGHEDAEELIARARELLESARVEFDAGAYDKASNLAEEARHLANNARDLLPDDLDEDDE